MSWPLQTQRDAFYGNPRSKSNPAKVDPAWEAANLVRVDFPWKAVLAWDTDTPVRSVRIHRRCAQSLVRVLQAIWSAAGRDQATIKAWGMHLYGGGFEYRPVRGGKALSSHSWGCAVDFDPERNGYGDTTPNFANVPEVLKAFADEGWEWGGPWRPKADGMHWQAARTW
jgi:hypothetical protein